MNRNCRSSQNCSGSQLGMRLFFFDPLDLDSGLRLYRR
jgi:hypothetical protein